MDALVDVDALVEGEVLTAVRGGVDQGAELGSEGLGDFWVRAETLTPAGEQDVEVLVGEALGKVMPFAMG